MPGSSAERGVSQRSWPDHLDKIVIEVSEPSILWKGGISTCQALVLSSDLWRIQSPVASPFSHCLGVG